MNIEYTTTTVDSPEYKRLICGRTDDITKLLSHINKGDSVALFGERRIGKTSLLYLLRDIINHEISTYQAELIDADLNNAIANLQVISSDIIAVYINLQELAQLNIGAFLNLIHRIFANSPSINTLVNSISFSDNTHLIETFQTINTSCANRHKKLVVLVDEIENLLENEEKFADGKQIFNNLKSIIQSCPKIRFIFAGAEEWHKQIKYKTSPVASNITIFYLKSPSRYAVENYLIKQILSRYIPNSPRNDLETAIKLILELTNTKPLYVQAIGQSLIEIYQQNQQLNPESQQEIITKVKESFGANLDYFYENNNLDIVFQKTLILLAKQPGLTVKQISAKLGYSRTKIYDVISDLESLDQIRKESSEYYIVGKLIEDWGRENKNTQTINPWIKRSKWTSVGILFLLIPAGYFYTHPKSVTSTCEFTNGKVEIEKPKSMELNENGEVTIEIKNTSSEVIKSLTIKFISEDIKFEYFNKEDSSNYLEFNDIGTNVENSKKMNFTAASQIYNRTFHSKIIIETNKSTNNNPCPIDFTQRRLPIKTYWWIVNPSILLVSGLITKKELLPIFLSLIPQLSIRGKFKEKP